MYTENIAVYTENPKEYTKQLLELNEFTKVMGYKANTQKPIILLCSSIKQLKYTDFLIPHL